MFDFGSWYNPSGGFGFGRDLDSVKEFGTFDDFRQLVLTLQSPPGFRRRHYQLENHETRGVLRQRALHTHRAMPHRCKYAFNRIRCAQVIPMIGGEVEKSPQRRTTTAP